ncbi:MAG: DUF5519 family protein [Acidobacteria bacterium]|nr:DUF5519 family protein [Acidobacteriota bacterium]
MAELKAQLREQILAIDGVEEKVWPGEAGEFRSFVVRGKDFAHFHGENELDLRLTKRWIAFHHLQHPKNSSHHPKRASGSPWIELAFNTEADLVQIMEWVKLAIRSI